MAAQFDLPGFDASPPKRRLEAPLRGSGRYSLFFALVPNDAQAAGLAEHAAALCTRFGLSATPIDAQRLHLTLFWLGNHAQEPTALAEGARRTGAAVAPPAPHLKLDRVLSFPREAGVKRPFVLCSDAAGAAAVARLRARLRAALIDTGLRASEVSLPHLTLAYDRLGIAEQAVEPWDWVADELALVCSHVGQSRHDRMARWRLGA